MAGIGKYLKGKKFELKSGNNPAFKMMAGDSPITNEFGIGKGASPYAQTDDSLTVDASSAEGKELLKQDSSGGGGGGGKKKGAGWKNAAQIALAGLTSGLDAVYGSGKIMPEGVKFSSSKKNDDDETPGEKLLREEKEAKEAKNEKKNK